MDRNPQENDFDSLGLDRNPPGKIAIFKYGRERGSLEEPKVPKSAPGLTKHDDDSSGENYNLGMNESGLKINGRHDESPKLEELSESEEECGAIDNSSDKEDSNEKPMKNDLSEALSEIELGYSMEFELLPEEEENIEKEEEYEDIEEEEEDIEEEYEDFEEEEEETEEDIEEEDDIEEEEEEDIEEEDDIEEEEEEDIEEEYEDDEYIEEEEEDEDFEDVDDEEFMQWFKTNLMRNAGP